MEMLEIEDCGPNMVIAALRQGVRNKDLKKALALDPPRTIDTLMKVAEKHMVAEEEMRASS